MSINLDLLRPDFREKVGDFESYCKAETFSYVLYCGFRSFQEQAQIYCQGRTAAQISTKARELDQKYGRSDLARMLKDVGPKPGRIVTKAGPGQSLHNYGLAVDGAPLRFGKIVWGTEGEDLKLWMKYGELVVKAGLSWAGNWVSFREFPHMELPGFDWHTEILTK